MIANEYERYVICEGKVRKSAKGAYYTYEQIKEIDKDYARILPSGIVMFDVDDEEKAKLLLSVLKDNTHHKPIKFNYVKSTRGYHFNFRTNLKTVPNVNHQYNWIGIELDIKGAGTDESDKVSYESMRVDGKLRVDVGWDGEREVPGGISLKDLDYAPKWLYHLPPDLRNILDDKAKLYTLGKVLYTQSMSDKGVVDMLIGDRNGFYFGIYMISCKNSGLSYEDYLEAVYTVNFMVADFKGWVHSEEGSITDEMLTWSGSRSLGKDEMGGATREEAWDGIEVREEDEMKQLLAIAEDLYLELNAIVDKKTGYLKIIDYRPEKNNFIYYKVNNDATIEDILKTDYKGVKVLTPSKEQDVIKFLAEIAKGRKDDSGENISWRDNDKEYYATYNDKKLVKDYEAIDLTREIYTSLVYNLGEYNKEIKSKWNKQFKVSGGKVSGDKDKTSGDSEDKDRGGEVSSEK